MYIVEFPNLHKKINLIRGIKMNINFKERANFSTLKNLEKIILFWENEINKQNIKINVFNNFIVLYKNKFIGSNKVAKLVFDFKNKFFYFALENQKQDIKYDYQFKTIYEVLRNKEYTINNFLKNGDLEYLHNIFYHFEKELALF